MHTHIDYSTLHYITLLYITWHYIALHCITLHHIALHRITLHYIAYCNISTVITLHYATLQYITLHIYHTYVYTCIYIYIHLIIYIYIIHIYLPCLICFLVPNTPASWAAFMLSQGKLWTCPALLHHMLLHSPMLKLRSHDLSWFTCTHTLALSTGDSMRSCLRQSIKTTILPKCGGIKENDAMTWIGRSQN